MTTSLPPSDALYHAQAKLFKRSEGRSAVAAAAYRSASLLHDERTGQDFDYRKKHAVAAFIVAPEGAPAWASDRQEIWNRAERAEKRKDAKVAREWEISIPRDIPPEEWESFARAVVAPYVEAGAIADVAIHCPRAADGEPQPHIHVMLTLRGLDPATESGFAPIRNSELESMHAVGSRGVGDRGDAIKAERERIAGVMNRFLDAAGSARLVSHLSNTDRGLDRDPEPTMGEERKHAVLKRRKHDAVTALVKSVRDTRILENQLLETEEEIMATAPKFQTDAAGGSIRPRHQQDFKKKLLTKHFPDAASAIDADKLHMIDQKNPKLIRIQTRDGGWAEVDSQHRVVRTYGKPGYADEVAKAIYNADYADHVEHLEEMQSLQVKGSGIRGRRRRDDPAPNLPMSEVESRADKWRSRGFTNIVEATDGTWVHIGSCKIQDLGNEVRIHGKVNDDAVRAMLLKAQDEWGSEVEIFGSREFKDRTWLEAQRMGVAIFDRESGELYQPSPDVRTAFEADRQRAAETADSMEHLKANKKISGLLKSAAGGDAEATTRLKNNDSDLYAFLNLHLDEDQRKSLAQESDEQMIPALAAFRAYGKKAREDEQKRPEDNRMPDLAERLAMEEAAKQEADAKSAPAPQ